MAGKAQCRSMNIVILDDYQDAVRKLRKRLDQFFSCCEQIMNEHASGLETVRNFKY